MVPSLGNLASFGVSTMDVSVSITVTLMLLRGNPWTLRLTGGYLLYILQTIARIHSSPIHGCHCCNVLVPRNQNGVACNFCTGAEGNTIEAVLGIASFCGGNSGQLLYLCSWCPGCSLCRGPWTRTATEKREVHIGCGDPVPSVWRWDQPVMELSKQSSKYPSNHQSIQAISNIWYLKVSHLVKTQVRWALMKCCYQKTNEPFFRGATTGEDAYFNKNAYFLLH